MTGTRRWFLWETTAWDDGHPGGRGPFDPFVTAETYHNRDGDALMGDGVLLYPGRQRGRFSEHSLGWTGVLPSIRLKNLRRGVEDAGYLELARGAHPGEASAIARGLLPRVLGEARPGQPPSWSEHGAPFFEARLDLARFVADGGADPGPPPGVGARPAHGAGSGAARASRRFWTRHLVHAQALTGALCFLGAVAVARRTLRRRGAAG
jgi:hypothetical protein